MVEYFLRLKIRLLANTFRRSPWQVVGMVVALLYGAGFAIVAIVGLLALRYVDVPIATAIVVTFGAVVVLGFFLAPLAFGIDDTLDPRNFSLFGIQTTKLAGGLLLTAAISVPSLVLIAVAVVQVATWSRGFGIGLLAVFGALLIVGTSVIGARVSTSLAAFFLSTRRAREITGLLALLVIVSLSPLLVVLSTVDWAREGLAVLERIAVIAGWTPFGVGWSIPAEAAAGNGGAAALKLLIGLATVAALWFAWRWLVARMLVTPERQASVHRYDGLGWFDRLPISPAWLVGARSLTYWMRDSRYRVQLVVLPVVPILMIVALLVAGVDAQLLALLPLPVMCLFLSWSVHNDVAYDNTAIWLHVVSSTPGAADRAGRLVPVLAIGVPLILVGAPISAAFHGDPDVLPSLIGVSAGLLLVGLGLSSIMSAWFPYPAVRPGDSPFAQPQSTGSAAALIQSMSFFATLVLVSPAIVFAYLGLTEGGANPTWSLLSGLGAGAVTLAAGILIGGRIFDRRGPELLAAALRN